ncbi:MAG: hypothetical protein F9K18_04110, partial [Thermoanaerobaculia bacterium]
MRLRSFLVLALALPLLAGAPALGQPDLAICRSAGFWSTHGGTEKLRSQNITQSLLDVGGPLEICGFELDNTLVGDPGSVLESMCVSPQGHPTLQLLRQLTAASLNCILSHQGPDCAGSTLSGLWAQCSNACLTSRNLQLVSDCVFQLECANEGGVAFPGPDGVPLCGPDAGCAGRDLCPDATDDGVLNGSDYCFEPIGPAGSSVACLEARQNGQMNRPPVADAGPDQSASLADVVQLDGSGSFDWDGDPLTYFWTLSSVPAGSTASLDDPTAVMPHFLLDRKGSYQASLVVFDGALYSRPDSVIVSTLNTAPVANAGPDQTIRVSETVQLEGSASTDPDGDLMTFLWSLVLRPPGSAASLSDPTSPQPSFTVDAPGLYVAQLIVHDGQVPSAPDSVRVTTENSPPVANAGQDQTTHVGMTVHLDGSASYDVDGDALLYTWSLVSMPAGSAAALDDATLIRPAFTIDLPGTYLAQLLVNDGTTESAPDTAAVTTANSPPIADAGADQSVFVGQVVWLDGSGSSDVDGDPLSFDWALTVRPPGSSAVLDDAALVRPSFIADQPGTYAAQLVVNDGAVDSAPDTVAVETANSAPIANAGHDQSAFVGDTVQLDGSGSSDVDGDALTFFWSLAGTPPGSTATLDDPLAVRPAFVVDLPGTYVAQLVVNDGTVDSAPDTAVVETENSPPVANAGPDQTVLVGDLVLLDGSGSYDADGDALAFAWSLLSAPAGSVATLNDPDTVLPTFTADRAGTYLIQLVVWDGFVESAPDSVVVSTLNSRPVAMAGPDQNAFVGDLVTLDGSASFDADGDALSFAWALTARPEGSTTVLEGADTAQASFAPDVPGTYVAQLIVSDGLLDSEPDTAAVEAILADRLTLSPDPLEILTLDSGEMTVALDLPAPAGGVEITLWSSDPGLATVPASVTILEGESTATFEVASGASAGSLSVHASGAALAETESAVTVAEREMTLSLVDTTVVGVGRGALLEVGLADPAPAGGATVTVASDTPSVVVVAPPGSATIASGDLTGQVELTGTGVGQGLVRATAPGYREATLTMNVTDDLLSLPATLTVELHQLVSIPITIQPDPAPAGGLVITLSSDGSGLEILTPTVTIPAGAFVASGIAHGTVPGTATVTARNPGFASDSSLVTITAEFVLLPDPVRFPRTFPPTVTIQLQAGGVPVAAPGGEVPFSITPEDAGCVAPVTGVIPEGLVSTTATLNYGGTAALPCTTSVTLHDTVITPDTVPVTVDPPPPLSLYNPNNTIDGYDVGAALQVQFHVNLSASQHGGVTVHVESSEP